MKLSKNKIAVALASIAGVTLAGAVSLLIAWLCGFVLPIALLSRHWLSALGAALLIGLIVGLIWKAKIIPG